MLRSTSLATSAALVILAITALPAAGQDTPKPSTAEGCTTINGVATGAGCEQTSGATGAGAVTQGMPATKHQQEVLKTGDQGASGQNMEATGAGGGAVPATSHQQDVLKKSEGTTTKGTTQP